MAVDAEEVTIPLQQTLYKFTKEEILEEKHDESKSKPRDSILLYLSASAGALTVLASASIVVWTSPAIARLQSNNTDENPLGTPATTFQISLLGGISTFGSIFGCLILTKLCDLIGRKKTIMFLSTMMLAATAGLAFAQTINLYYITRFISGLGMGAAVPCVSIFLSEISEDHNRATIGSLIGISLPLGNLYIYILGPLFSIKTFTLLCCIPYLLNLLAFLFFVPDSPSYLALKGDKEGAIASLKKLRNKTESELEKEYETIMYTLEHHDHSKGGLKVIFNDRGLRKGFIISVALNSIQQLTGVVAIMAFAAPLFDAAGTGLSGNAVGVLIGLTKLASMFLTAIIIEKSGRRPLLLVSTLGIAICLYVLGLYFYLKSIYSPIVDKIFWLPLVAIVLYFVFFGSGIGAIPLAIMSELFPSSVKTTAVTFSSVSCFTCMVALTTAFPILNKAVGEAWCLWAFGVFTTLGYVFIYMVVPEIKGKSLLEVQKILRR